MTQVMNRRQMLKGAGVVGAAALAALAPASAFASNGESADAIEGGWRGSVSFPGLSFELLFAFAAGGGLVGSGSVDLSPSFLSTPVYGTWVETGEDTFGLTFFFFTFDPKGTPTGTTKVRAKAKLDEASHKLSGPTTVDVFDPAGAHLFSFSGTFELARIRVEPL